MRFQILGPIRVRTSRQEFTITAGRERTLLALLLLHVNHPVSTDRLIDTIWPANPPLDARNQLQRCVHLLRKRLTDAGIGRHVIVTDPGGYRLAADPTDVDLLEFRRLVAEARATAKTEPAEAVGHYRSALRLWHGSALSDVDSEPVRNAATGLDEEHVHVLEECIDLDITLGGAGELVAQLTTLVHQHPHRERLHRCLMLALYRAGRQADALAAYRNARQLLHDELGVEPGRELQDLHRAILNRDLDLDDVSRPTRLTPSPPTPRALPADIAGFTGRADALKSLDELLLTGQDGAGPVVISAIAGTAGVGKTALAVHWAHRVADRFPDGQLYLNLRGYDPEQPTSPVDALARLLTALGVAGQDIPMELDDRVARYRTEVATRRLLVVLDNAATVEQVRPLLPGSASCAVVVTSRDRLAGLVALDGAHRLDLDLLPPADAITLLRRLIGPRVDDEEDAAAALAGQCARLPLALRIAAELAVSRPTAPLANLVAELADQQRRLDLLDTGGDAYATVRTVFSWSIKHLPPEAGRTFRLLGVHPGPDADPYAAAALAGTNLDDAHRRLELLARAHLLQPAGPGRYGMHDLLRAYAADLTLIHDTEPVRHAAQSRLLDYYRHTASVAMDTAYPYERERRPRIPSTDTPTPDLSDPDQATSWLDSEHHNLLAAARHAADHGWPEHTLNLSAILHRHLRTRGRYRDAETLHHRAMTTARSIGDRAGELNALLGLGWVYRLQGRHGQAIDHYQQALETARATGDRAGELNTLTGVGRIHLMQGRHGQAIDSYQQALKTARATGHHTGELDALTGLGWVHRLQGRHEQAAGHYQQALEIARATGHHTGELTALNGLGLTQLLQGRHGQAIDHYQQALKIARATGHHTAGVAALHGLGHIHHLQGRHGQAADHYQQVLDVARETGDRNWQFEALRALGRLHHTMGSPDAALAYHQQALELATELGQPDDQARAHDGLAHAHHALNQPEQAREHWQQALDILTSLGTDHTEDPEANTSTIRSHLAAIAER